MDAGNFNLNFGNVGGPNRFHKAPGPNQNQETGRGFEDKGPRDEVNFGGFSLPETGRDIRTESNNEPTEVAKPGNLGKTEPTFSLSGPLMLNSVGAVSSTGLSNVDTGITALNGINSTTLFTLDGKTIASVNAFNPVSPTRVPTTSVFTNGLESNELVGISGKVLSNEVRMPTTSVGTNGLEDTSWTTFNGRTITLT